MKREEYIKRAKVAIRENLVDYCESDGEIKLANSQADDVDKFTTIGECIEWTKDQGWDIESAFAFFIRIAVEDIQPGDTDNIDNRGWST